MMAWLEMHGGLLALLGFVSMFIAFAFWAYRPSNKRRMEDYGQIPLKESRNGE